MVSDVLEASDLVFNRHASQCAELGDEPRGSRTPKPRHARQEADRDRAYREHFAGLDEMYFLKGEQRLAGLRAWAAGRANPSKAFPGGVVPEGL